MNLFDRLLGAESVGDARRTLLETVEGRVWTYGEFRHLAEQIAHALRARGVGVGDRVVAQVEKSPEALALYLACLRAGAVYVPLNPAYTAREVAYFLEDAEPAVFVCDPARHGEFVAAEAWPRAVETLGSNGDGSLLLLASAQSTEFPTVPRGEDDRAAIVYTSGTTGRSKGAMLSHGNLLTNAEALVEAWHFRKADGVTESGRSPEADVLLHALPIYHVHGLFVALHTVLLAGGSLLWLPRFDVDLVLRLLPRATVFMGVPTYYTRLLARVAEAPERVAGMSGMRLFTSGSAPLSAETHREFAERTGHAIVERYGMTETGMNTSNPYSGERVAGTVGIPLPGVELRICDPDTGAPIPCGDVGMIEVRGPNVFPGYWRMPERSREEFRPGGWFLTGDLGRIDERGYVSIVGRGKDLIITGGLNVYPKEVEEEIEALPGVAECAVIGVPHPDFGEAVVAVVVLRGSGHPEGARASVRDAHADVLLTALRGRLASFKLPKRVVFVDELPRNSMGKVQKNRLREEYGDLFR